MLPKMLPKILPRPIIRSSSPPPKRHALSILPPLRSQSVAKQNKTISLYSFTDIKNNLIREKNTYNALNQYIDRLSHVCSDHQNKITFLIKELRRLKINLKENLKKTK